jgi:hypothetical protein
MENFTLQNNIGVAGQIHYIRYMLSQQLKNALASQAIKTTIRDQLTESRIAADGETPFELMDEMNDVTWTNNVIDIQVYKPNGRLVIAHKNGEHYNEEQFRSRIETIKRIMLEAAGIPLPAGSGRKRGGDRRFKLTTTPEEDEHVYQYTITDQTRNAIQSNVDAIRTALNTLVQDGELESGTSFSNSGSFDLRNNKIRIFVSGANLVIRHLSPTTYDQVTFRKDVNKIVHGVLASQVTTGGKRRKTRKNLKSRRRTTRK